MAGIDRDGVALLPLGALHPHDRCADCGARPGHLRRVVMKATLAEGFLCVDVVECMRRARRRRQLDLFGSDAA